MKTVTNLVSLGLMMLLGQYLQGCAPTYGCELKNKDGYCADMEQTFRASRGGGGDKESVFSAGEKDDEDEEGDSDGEYFENLSTQDVGSNMGNPPTLGSPVYDPGKPWRIFIMPWKDASNILHGGEYIFVATAPKWNYGTMRDDGAASGLLGPLDSNPHANPNSGQEKGFGGRVPPKTNFLPDALNNKGR